jgi:hypothetical protein
LYAVWCNNSALELIIVCMITYFFYTLCIRACLKSWAVCYIYADGNWWSQWIVVGASSLVFVTKVKVWRFLSNFQKVIFTLLWNVTLIVFLWRFLSKLTVMFSSVAFVGAFHPSSCWWCVFNAYVYGAHCPDHYHVCWPIYDLGLDACLYRDKLKWHEAYP